MMQIALWINILILLYLITLANSNSIKSLSINASNKTISSLVSLNSNCLVSSHEVVVHVLKVVLLFLLLLVYYLAVGAHYVNASFGLMYNLLILPPIILIGSKNICRICILLDIIDPRDLLAWWDCWSHDLATGAWSSDFIRIVVHNYNCIILYEYFGF